MLKEERHQHILQEVALHNRILLTDIADTLNVSIDTIRRDVKELDINQKLRKVHGGAISLGFASYRAPNADTYALAKKNQIAKKAITLLKDGSVIIVDGGTTCLEMVRILPTNINLTCFTLSLAVATELMNKPNIRVIFIGGEIAKQSQISIGPSAINTLSEIQVDYSFIGTGYVDSLHGLTEFDWDVVQVKRALIKATKKTILLCISEKLNSQHRYKTCNINAINTMITELEPENNLLNLFRNHDFRLL